MEIYERIRELRKELRLSQSQFGERLGVSRSVIKNIELNALAKPEQKLSLYKLICSEFKVSEDWLLHGKGKMYASDEDEYSVLIDQIMEGEDEFAKSVFKSFAKLDVEDWEALYKLIQKLLSAATAADPSFLVPDTPEELEKLYPPVDIDELEEKAE